MLFTDVQPYDSDVLHLSIANFTLVCNRCVSSLVMQYTINAYKTRPHNN